MRLICTNLLDRTEAELDKAVDFTTQKVSAER